jgi:hypothetical protein
MTAPVSPSELRELAETTARKVEAVAEPGAGNAGHDLRIVTKSLMRGMIVQGKAVAVVCESGLGWAAGSNLRSMFELHLDIRFMLHGPEPERRARRIVLYAMHDMAHSTPDEPNPILLAAIESFRKIDPEACADFETAWKKNRGHWSGSSRTAVMKDLEPTSSELRRMYKWYSWGAHMVLEPVLDYDWSEHGGRHRSSRNVEEPSDQGACTPAAALLHDSWTLLANHFGVAV